MSMKRIFVMLIAITVISAPAFAGLLNGDMTSGLAMLDQHPPVDGRVTDWHVYDLHGTQTDHSTAYGVAATYTRWSMTMTAYSGTSAIMANKGCDTTGGYFGIYQTVATVPGHTYILKSKINSVSNIAKGSTKQWGYYLFVTNGTGFTKPDDSLAYAYGRSNNMLDTGSTGGWVEKSTSFTAASTSTTLAWLAYVDSSAADSKGHFLGVDNVVIPEPGSMLALGTGLLALVGIIRRKR